MYIIKQNGRGPILARAKTDLEAQKKCTALADKAKAGTIFTYEEE